MIFESVLGCSKFKILIIRLHSGKFIIIVIEKNIYSLGVISNIYD